MSFSPKKLILIGLGVILLIAIPLTVYLVQKQQQVRSNAAPSTTLSFEPSSKTAAVGDTMSFDIIIDPGTNEVSTINLTLDYDPTKLSTAGAGLVIDNSVLRETVIEPTYTPGKITGAFSTGTDTTKPIITRETIATVTFQAIAQTDQGVPTRITFDPSTLVLPLGSDVNSNMLTGTNPALVTITGVSISPTPTLTPTLVPTVTVTPTPTVPQVTATPTPTSALVNQIPACSSLALNTSSTGTAPYSLIFTAAGTDPDGTISKVSFSFGDGTTQDVTDGSGIGTNSVNAQVSHVYNTAGTFDATVLLTDNSGGVSSGATCTQTIIVTAAGSGGGGGGIPQAPTAEPTAIPTLAPTGPSNTLLGIGVFGIIFILIGGVILFIL